MKNSYPEIKITEKIKNIFLPTRLIIKKLNETYYFCKSTRQDVEKYLGSGVHWKNKIKKHGRDKVVTLWVSDWYYDPQEIHDVALHFSRENDIVHSESWANQVPEWGIDSYTKSGTKESAETRLKKSIAHRGEKSPTYGKRGPLSHNYGRQHSDETKMKQSLGLKRYSRNRPKSHNENISKSLTGNPLLQERVKGEKNPSFKGYCISPSGEIFDSSLKAAKSIGVDKCTVLSWARNGKHGWRYKPK